MLPESAMGIDSSTSLSWPSSNRRLNLTPARLRLREERKRIIRALDAKYRTIDDHERGMRRFVLIRNNLRRLQREAREEKLARHRAGVGGSKVSNLSPSCLSATRPRSPSPPCEYGYPESSSLFGGMTAPLFGDDPPTKRQRLFFDDDKENEMEVDASPEDEAKGSTSPCRPVDDAQEILRDLYETCVSEGITQRTTPSLSCPSSPSSYTESSYSSSSSQPQTHQAASYSLSMSASCSVSAQNLNNCNTNNNNNSSNNCDGDWPRHSQYPFNCGHSSLLGNDLQSVVFHSLITSLES